MGTPLTRDQLGKASQVASAIRTAAAMAVQSFGWGRSLFFHAPFFGHGEGAENGEVWLLPYRTTVRHELVVADFDPDSGFPLSESFRQVVCKELLPFIIGVGEVRADLTPKGLVLTLAENRQDKNSAPGHGAYSSFGVANVAPITRQMIEAGASVIERHAGTYPGYDPFSVAEQVFLAMEACRRNKLRPGRERGRVRSDRERTAQDH